MQTVQFSVLINADKKTVWNTMLADKTYREWTKEFTDGSYYQGSWERGSEIRFLAKDDKGNLGGMFSRIKENIEHRFISIEHLGVITNGLVDTTSEHVRKWAPSFENYTFTENDGKTEVIVDMQIEEEYKTMFDNMWPRALMALKRICEQQPHAWR